MNYREIPALAAYIDRIGAKQKNFKRFIVEEPFNDHYYIERSLIEINRDGEVICPNKEHAPTHEEAIAIKAAISTVKFPKHVNATPAAVRAFLKTKENPDTFYQLRAHRNNDIVMMQQRVMIDGKKNFLPWTFWSDAEWRCMEPEGRLPYWKPPLDRKPRKVMVHEGPKTAKFVDELVNDPERKKELAGHPWGEALKEYQHWGWIGGALAPLRTDYAELRAEKATEIVYFCDNDYAGKTAVRDISRCYGHQLKCIMVNDKWPLAWDLADPMPQNLYADNGNYIGPSLPALIQPATFATEKIPNPDGGSKRITVLRKEFAEEWFHCVKPEVFVHHNHPSMIWSPTEFNNRVRPFSDVDDTARLLRMDFAGKAAVLKYSPAMKSGVYNDADGNRYINTHVPSTIVAQKGDTGPWINFLKHLIPDEADRLELMRWCATLIARPDLKMLYGVLLISETQGVGKGTLGERILKPLLGDGNVSAPSEREVVESDFNSWCAHKRLAIVHEIYAGHSSKAYDKLKSIITDNSITVNQKFQSTYEIENWIHIFACSNSHLALKLSNNDRRWFVPQVAEEKRDVAFWKKLTHWLLEENGLAIIRWWADEFLKKNSPVMTGEGAPSSKTKERVIEESYAPGQRLLSRFFEYAAIEFKGKPCLTTDISLVQMVRDQIYDGKYNDRIERPLTIRKMAKAKNWFVGEERAQIKEWGLGGTHARIITNNEEWAKSSPSSLLGKGVKPLDVSRLANEWFNT